MSEAHKNGWFTPPDRPVEGQTVHVRPGPVTATCAVGCGELVDLRRPHGVLARNVEHQDRWGNDHADDATVIARWHLACGDHLHITASHITAGLRSAPADVRDGHNPAPAEVV